MSSNDKAWMVDALKALEAEHAEALARVGRVEVAIESLRNVMGMLGPVAELAPARSRKPVRRRLKRAAKRLAKTKNTPPAPAVGNECGEAILSALRLAKAPLSRKELIDRTGFKVFQVARALDALGSRIVRTGNRRSARVSLPGKSAKEDL